MFTPVYDAVRVAERESQSARPDSPVIPEREQRRRVASTRLFVSEQLHRMAEAIAPSGELIDPRLSTNQPTSC